MIARDEARWLADCLASVRGIVDEIVVVDTGSRDETPAIARQYGARVIEHAWRDDFADARNESVKHATGAWVLVLDADERLPPGAGPTVDAAVREAGLAGVECGLVRIHDASSLDAQATDVITGRARLGEPALVPRLLRRTSDLRWRGVVHEDLADWVLAGHRAAPVAIDVVHLGRVPSVVAAKGKSARNRRLLEARCANERADPTPFGYLAFELMDAGEREAAWKVADRGWEIVARGPGGRSVARLAVARAVLQLGAGDLEGALATARLAERYEPGNHDLAYLRGQALEALALRTPGPKGDLLVQAEAAYRDALAPSATAAVSLVAGARSWGSEVRLGTVLLLAGRPHEALAAFDRALANQPDDREARLGRVEARVALGDPAGALAEAKALLDDRPDAWLLAADAMTSLGFQDQAAALRARAAERSGNGFVGRHRRAKLTG